MDVAIDNKEDFTINVIRALRESQLHPEYKRDYC